MDPSRQRVMTGGHQQLSAQMRNAPPRAPSAMRTQMQLTQPSHNPYHALPLPTRPPAGAPTLPTSPMVLDPNTGQSIPNQYAVDLSKRPTVFQPVTFSRPRVRSRASRAPLPRLAYQPYPPNWPIALGPPPLMPESQGLMPQPQPQRHMPQPHPQYLAHRAQAAVGGYLKDAPTQFPMAGHLQSLPGTAPPSTLLPGQRQMITATDVSHMHMPMQSAPAEDTQKAEFTQSLKQSRAVPIKNEQGEVVKFDPTGNKGRQLHLHRPQASFQTDVLDDDESPIPQDMQLGRMVRKEFSQPPGPLGRAEYGVVGHDYSFDEQQPEIQFTAKDETMKERQERELAAAKETMDRKVTEKALQHAIAARQQTVMELKEVQEQARIHAMMEGIEQENAERFGAVTTSGNNQQLIQHGGTSQNEGQDEEAVGADEVGDGPGPAVVTEVQPTIVDLARELRELREVMVLIAEQMLRLESRIDRN